MKTGFCFQLSRLHQNFSREVTLINIRLTLPRGFLFTWVAVAFFAVIPLAGCSRSFSAKSEPTAFVVRNLTDQHIQSFSLRASSPKKHKSSRYGTIAPVPQGAEQVYLRPSVAPPLPAQVVAEWVMRDGKVHSSLVVFKELFKAGWSPTERVLYFNLYPKGQLRLSLQQDAP